MKGKGCLRFFLYIFLLAFANGFIEDFLKIDLDGVTKIFSIIIIAGSIEFIIDQLFKSFSSNTKKNIFENLKNIIFPRKKKRKKGDPFL
tara:strand:+ start:1147 stop:1413 length:267 start_codon:yes stop_codon:yes gene_type:complete